MKNFIKKETYEKKLQKIKEASERKQSRLKKRIELQLTKSKLPRINALKKTLKTITHKIVRYRYSMCYSCGKEFEYSKRQAGHFWTDGGHGAVRYDFDNLRTQCSQCNQWKGGDAAYANRLLNELGLGQFRALAQRANSIHKWTREELQQLISEREKMLEEYKSKLSNL